MTCPKCERGGVGKHPASCTETTRFWHNVSKTETCWLWTGGVSPNGYGKTSGKYAHRLSWEIHRGALPRIRSMVVDHLCRNRLCVNPDHLELVTQQENINRGEMGVLKTGCPAGHPYPEYARRRATSGRRFCIACRRASDRLRRKSA
jgi:hypothetical protein